MKQEYKTEDYLVGRRVKVLTGSGDLESQFIIGKFIGYSVGNVYAVVEIETFMEMNIEGVPKRILVPGKIAYIPTALHIIVQCREGDE